MPLLSIVADLDVRGEDTIGFALATQLRGRNAARGDRFRRHGDRPGLGLACILEECLPSDLTVRHTTKKREIGSYEPIFFAAANP